ncbi:PREDICTED: uncharacterized protein LOC109130849 [Camelina sativa]|uniref:Uncharacterized protein LOC109130849 n=1 Tax=Camelina sativa TaxID=90675 RepID=A0ABM1RBS5_CAMSA|nr:PREDICTED: uncharacterized protein LOC109130849 [Camelina sativa]
MGSVPKAKPQVLTSLLFRQNSFALSKYQNKSLNKKQDLLKMLKLLRNLRKSPRVADESALPPTAVDGDYGGEDGSNNGMMMKFPLSIMSCFAVPRVSKTDGVWVSGDYGRVSSEVNHLMVCDGMRYALLM